MNLYTTLIAFAVASTLVFSAPVSAQTYSIGSNPQGSLFYATGTAISKVMIEATDKQFRVAPYGGSSTYLPMVARGDLEFGLTNSGEAAFAYLGKGMFEDRGNPDLRLVGSLFNAINGWMVRADSDIHHTRDLAGKRVTSTFSAGQTFNYLAGANLAAAEMNWADVKRIPVSTYVQGVDLLIDGRVDAAYSTVGVAAAQKAMASIDGGIRFIPTDHSGDVAKRMSWVMPTARPVTMSPSSADNGITEDPTELMQMEFVVVTGGSMSDEEVYQLAKTLYQSKPELSSALGAFNRFNPDSMVGESPVKYHPGAIRFYKEVGLWDDAD